jgi:hypothetical protein
MRTRTIPILILLALCPSVGRALDFTPHICTAPLDFADVPADDPYCPWIHRLALDGLSLGCGGGTFCPQQPMSRAAAAAVFERAMRGTASWSPTSGYYARTIVVSPLPGGPLASGAALRAAVQRTSLAGPDNRFLIKLEPGVYDVSGTTGVDMNHYVDLEGSGIGVTTIVAQTLSDSSLLGLPGDNEVRLLTVRGESSMGNPASVSAYNQGSARLSRVRVVSLHGTAVECGTGSALRIVHSTIESEASFALRLLGCQGIVEDSELAVRNASSATKAIGVYECNLDLRRSDVFAGTFNGFNVALDAADATVRVEGTHLRADGGPYSNPQVETIRLARSNATIVKSDLEATGQGPNLWTLRANSDAGSYTTSVRESRFSHGSIQASAHDVVHIANSQLDQADADTNGGTIGCFKSYDENFDNSSGYFMACP